MMRIDPTNVIAHNLGYPTSGTGYIPYIDIETHKHIIDIYIKGEHTERYEFETKDEWLTKINELRSH